jgi:hypothetical protein
MVLKIGYKCLIIIKDMMLLLLLLVIKPILKTVKLINKLHLILLLKVMLDIVKSQLKKDKVSKCSFNLLLQIYLSLNNYKNNPKMISLIRPTPHKGWKELIGIVGVETKYQLEKLIEKLL